MDDGTVREVRRFNRTVTQQVGALDEAFLARGRPLGHSRVLWEVGPDGAEVRALRSRLGLDSGYLSRLLRSLETVELRMDRAGQNAAKVCAFLASHPKVEGLGYLGMIDDPRQQDG